MVFSRGILVNSESTSRLPIKSLLYWCARFFSIIYSFGLLVYTFAYRCLKICSDWTKFHGELSFLNQVFLKDGYLLYFIDN